MKLKQFFCRHKEIEVFPIEMSNDDRTFTLSIKPICHRCRKIFGISYIWADIHSDFIHPVNKQQIPFLNK